MLYQFVRVSLIFLILGIAGTVYSQKSEWEKVASPVSVTLTNLSFVNNSTGWASGDSGTIIKTTDGGNNWQIQNSTVSFFIMDLFFLNENRGWALTVKDVFPFNSIILKTTNGGNRWIAENFQDSTALMRTIFFFDTLHGFIGGSYIAETTDGGNTWAKSEIDSSLLSSYPVYKFKFYSEEFGYACGGAKDFAGVIWRTTNYGQNWAAEGVSADQVFDLFIFDSFNAITLSGDPEGFFGTAKINTADGGLNWDYEELQLFGLSFALDFRIPNEGWSASGYKFLFSSDAGETWDQKNIPDSEIIYDLQFTDSLTGFAVGAEGVILKYLPQPVSIDDELPNLKDFALNQNFPNPFNSTTVISWHLPDDDYVKLNIYNSLGEEVFSIIDEYLPAGAHSISFTSNSELPSGLYLYRLQAGSFSQTKKMIYLK
jgi:photosystem II stability/assembly factor-like uncharacterized protein